MAVYDTVYQDTRDLKRLPKEIRTLPLDVNYMSVLLNDRVKAKAMPNNDLEDLIKQINEINNTNSVISVRDDLSGNDSAKNEKKEKIKLATSLFAELKQRVMLDPGHLLHIP